MEKAGGGLGEIQRALPWQRDALTFPASLVQWSASSSAVCESDIDFSWLVQTLIRSVAHQVGSIVMFKELLFRRWKDSSSSMFVYLHKWLSFLRLCFRGSCGEHLSCFRSLSNTNTCTHTHTLDTKHSNVSCPFLLGIGGSCPITAQMD